MKVHSVLVNKNDFINQALVNSCQYFCWPISASHLHNTCIIDASPNAAHWVPKFDPLDVMQAPNVAKKFPFLILKMAIHHTHLSVLVSH